MDKRNFGFFAFVLSAVFFVSIDTVQAQYSVKRRAQIPSVNVSERAGNVFVDERRIFDYVNQERRKRGMQDLQFDNELSNLARKYSQQMADENFFSHYDSEGWSVVDRAKANRVKGWKKIGENLFYYEGFDDFTAFAVKKWMKSPLHRDNILDPEFNRAGLGIASSRNGRIYITQVFLRK